MQFTVEQGFNASAEVAAAANFPHIRLFTAGEVPSLAPLTELDAKAGVAQPWSVASPASVGGGNWSHFSAVRRAPFCLAIICCQISHTYMYLQVCWFFGRETYLKQNYPIGLIASDWGGTRDEAWMDAASLSACNTSNTKVSSENSPLVATEERSATQKISPEQGSVLFNGMVHPFIRTTIYGAIW